LGLKPNVWLCATNFDIPPNFRELQRLKDVVVRLQDLFTEPGPDFANRLKFFRVTVIACEEECAVYVGPFPFAVVSTDDNEIQRVADAG
jgi:hypothetical protein